MTDKPSEFLPSDNGDESQDEEGVSVQTRLLDRFSDNGPMVIVAVVSIIAAAIGYAGAALFVDGALCVFQILNQVLGNFGVGSGIESEDLMKQMETMFITCAKSNAFGPVRVISGLGGALFAGYPTYSSLKSATEGSLLR